MKRFTKTYTKKLTRNMLFVGTLGGMMPYVLAFCGKEPVSELGQVWVLGVVAVCIGYFVRGFKDTKSMKDDRYRRERLGVLMEETDQDEYIE